MADLAGSIFAGLKALYTADTGAGGLSESSDTGVLVRHFVRTGDPNFARDRTGNWPAVEVDVFTAADRTFGARHALATIRMHVYTQRDINISDLTSQDSVSGRVYDLYDGAQIATQGGFTFSLLHWLRDFQGPTTGTELHRIHEFTVLPQV